MVDDQELRFLAAAVNMVHAHSYIPDEAIEHAGELTMDIEAFKKLRHAHKVWLYGLDTDDLKEK